MSSGIRHSWVRTNFCGKTSKNWRLSVKVGDLVETYEFGVGILVEIMFNNYRVLYPSGKWYWTTKPDLELISENR